VFDSLNYVDNIKFGIDSVRAAGGVAEATLCYTGDVSNPSRKQVSGVHACCDTPAQPFHSSRKNKKPHVEPATLTCAATHIRTHAHANVDKSRGHPRLP